MGIEADTERDLRAAFDAAVRAVDPMGLVRIAAGLEVAGRCVVLAVGKAARGLAAGAEQRWGDTIVHGVAISPHGEPPRPALPDRWRLVPGSHPIPDASSEAAGRAALAAARRAAGLASGAEPCVLVALVSGGASAMMEVPALGLTIVDIASANTVLVGSGASIEDINTVRKHLSAVKGGRLAAAAQPATVVTGAISDVVGDRIDMIASGPTVPDPTTYDDALAVIHRFGLADRLPSPVVAHLEAGARGQIPETPKTLPDARATILAGGRDAARAASRSLEQRGIRATVATTPLRGEAAEAARRVLTARPPSGAMVHHGETVVTLGPRHGTGGRNLEAALAAALVLDGDRGGAAFLAAGTDGIDGNAPAAGAVVDGATAGAIRAAGIDPEAALRDHDAYPALEAADAVIVTGPTGTNVGDIWIVAAGS